MSRAALHCEVIRECLRSARAARTKAMELSAEDGRVEVLADIERVTARLTESLALRLESLRAEVDVA